MAKKNYTIRLYRTHDHDLISFMSAHQFNIVKAVYSAVTAFSHGDLFLIKVPPLREGGHLEFNRVYARMLTLDTEQDAAAIEMLEKLKDGSKNNFLKNLLRMYLCLPVSELSLKDINDADYFYEKFAIFREGKREVNAGKINTSDKKIRKKDGVADNSLTKLQPKKETMIHHDEKTHINKQDGPQEFKEEHTVIEEPDFESVTEDIKENENRDEMDEITDMFSSILN